MATDTNRSQTFLPASTDPRFDPFQLLAESVKEYAVFTLDPDGNVSSWNIGAERITGYKSEEILGRCFSEFYTAADGASGKPQTLLETAVLKGRCADEGQQRRNGGELFWARVTLTAVRNADETVRGFVNVVQDLTEWKRAETSVNTSEAALHASQAALYTAENALLASEARYRTLFEYSKVGVVLADDQSFYIDANAGACRMLGYSRDELIGLHASDIVAPAEIQHIGPALGEINSESDHYREWLFRRKDGSVFAGDVVATLMPDRTLLGIISDISDRKRAHEYREHLASIVESSLDAIIGTDLNAIITSWNAGAEKTFGYSKDEMMGSSNTRLVPGDRRDEENRLLAQLVRGERVEPLETLRRTKDGRLLDVLVTASPIKDASGQVVGAS
ncbi:MAG TPA: PAS domain S-box protein, partial [Blastocatellia bacterium]|nr:PAS domain S-box protein [Blastocatellia bacterium]